MAAESVAVATLVDWLARFHAAVTEKKAWLTDLDAAIGDADHGINLARGCDVIQVKVLADPPATVDALMKAVGLALVSNVGGASGPLYGTFFLRFGAAAGPVEALSGEELSRCLRAGLDGLVARGKAELGDKTMVDAMTPALDALDRELSSGVTLGAAVSAAAAAAAEGRDATVPLVARKGRASYLGERSAGHVDPGSASTALLFAALAEALSG